MFPTLVLHLQSHRQPTKSSRQFLGFSFFSVLVLSMSLRSYIFVKVPPSVVGSSYHLQRDIQGKNKM